jgi:trimeric autotransporter adhesin
MDGTIVGLATTECITINTAGTYSVTVTGAGLGACISTCMKTVTIVNPVIPPIIIASGVTTFCAGGNVILSGNTNGGIWTTTSATPILMPTATSIIVSTSGIYRLTNTNSCGNLFNEIIITVNSLPNCMITGNGILCEGNMTTLCAPATSILNPLTYIWNTIPSVSTNCIITETAGIYTVTVTDANGCQNNCSKAVIVNPLPNPKAGGALTICHCCTTWYCTNCRTHLYMDTYNRFKQSKYCKSFCITVYYDNLYFDRNNYCDRLL